jgi:autophagy-related protein 17
LVSTTIIPNLDALDLHRIPAMATSRPASSAEPRSRPVSYHDPVSPEFEDPIVPAEVLVRHLLAAKQSLSSMALVLRANDLATHARQMHEESVILGAQTGFLRQLMADEVRLLRKLRRGMGHAYDRGAREFQQLLVTLDAAHEKLEQTMRMLRETRVEPVFRPPGEEAKCLMDFVDENSVEGMRDALKGSIAELQVSADACHSCRTLAHCSTGCPHVR